MARFLALLLSFFLASGVIAISPAAADDSEQCAHTDPSNDVRIAALIAACTRIIDSGKLKGATLAATYHHRAVGWFSKGDLDSMIADLDQAIRLDPNDAHQYFMRGIALRGKGSYQRSVADLNQAIRMDPQSVFYKERGIALHLSHDYDRAIRDFDEAIRLDPTDDEIFRYRGDAWHAKGVDDRAIPDYKEALRLRGGR